MDTVKDKKRYEKYLILLILLSLYLSLAETLIPKPFPWLKVGLANIGGIIALEKFGKQMAVEVVVLRILILVIKSHCNHHRAAAYTRNNIGNTNYHSLKYLF